MKIQYDKPETFNKLLSTEVYIMKKGRRNDSLQPKIGSFLRQQSTTTPQVSREALLPLLSPAG